MSETKIVPRKNLLPAVVKKDDKAEAFAIVKYERIDKGHYSFFYDFDGTSSFRMDETDQTADRTDFSEAEFDKDVPESQRVYYSVAAACGILGGVLSSFHFSEEQLASINEFKEKEWKNWIIKAANISGFKKDDFKGAVDYLVTKAVRTFEKNEKAKGCLVKMAEHPSIAGLVFSLMTQYSGNTIMLSDDGKIIKHKLPDYYVIGEADSDKIICAVFYWLFALSADEVMSKRHILDELRMPKVLLKYIKQFAHFPFMKSIPANYEEAEKAFSKWLEKTIKGVGQFTGEEDIRDNVFYSAMNIALNRTEDVFTVLLNECLVRSAYVLLRVCSLVKEQKITSFEDLMNIPVLDTLSKDERLLSRMSWIASGLFAGANIGIAAAKAALGKKVGDKKFAEVFLAEINIFGVGRFLFWCIADSKYWGDDLQVFFERNKKSGADAGGNSHQNVGDNSAFEPLLLDALQSRILYCLESISVQYDIRGTRKADIADKKQKWLDKWKRVIVSGIGVPEEYWDKYFVDNEDDIYDEIYRLARDKSNWRWFYLLTQELALFKPYSALGCEDDKDFSKLKKETDYVKDQFVRRQTIASQEEVDLIVSTYGKYKGYVSGSTRSKIIGAGVAAVATVATGGLALAYAPSIAISIAGEAVVGFHGAALTSASLAFVGGGSLAAGGLGMAGGTAIITGGGALLGLAGSGTVSAAAILLQTPSQYWVRQSAKLLTYCKCILIQNLKEKKAVQAILEQIEIILTDTEQELNEIKKEKNELDKDLIKKTEDYLKYLSKCREELKKLSKGA